MFNTNLWHNISNVLIALIAAMMAFDWSVLFTAETGAMIISALATIKLVVNAVRDGLAGMVKPQPPVQT
jgi:hypothetical protein